MIDKSIPIKIGEGAHCVLHGDQGISYEGENVEDLLDLGGTGGSPKVDEHARAVLHGGPPEFGPEK